MTEKIRMRKEVGIFSAVSLIAGVIIGSGSHWPDTSILLANNVYVSAAPRYASLLNMVSAKRFDCLNRSLKITKCGDQDDGS